MCQRSPSVNLPHARIVEVVVDDHRSTRRGVDAIRLHGTLASDGPLTVAQLRRWHWTLTDAQFGRALCAAYRSGLVTVELGTHEALVGVGDYEPVGTRLVAVNPAGAVAA